MKATDKQAEAKARELLAQLTLDEKCNMMHGDMPFWAGVADMVGGGYAHHTWNAGSIPRLGIPGIRFADGPRGIVLEGATTFPVAMARGATWDIELEERIGEAIGAELRAFGGNLFGGICINLLRHPAWGRAQETYGEDSYHLGEMGAALTRGVQNHAMACVKHYALNSMENSRFKLDVSISPRALHEIYLPHFKRIIDEGVAAVMSAYNSVNGEWCGQNKALLTDILKEQWGFKGYVLTDFIFGIRSTSKAVSAGQNMEMPFPIFYKRLKKLVSDGQVPWEQIDDAVLRMLRQQLRLDQDKSYDRNLIGCESHRALAREAAQRSMVLIKNEGNLLPLQNIRKLAVIGQLANTPNTGDQGSSNTRPDYVITPLEGIKAALENKAEVVFDDASNVDSTKSIAQSADAVILVVGYTYEDEGEFLTPESQKELMSFFPRPSFKDIPSLIKLGYRNFTSRKKMAFSSGGDRDSLTLRPEDEALIKTVASVNRNTIAAIMGGSAIIMEEWRECVPAILMVWYPGMEGGRALADILLGKANPSGKLPFVIPTDAEHLPSFDKNATKIEYDLWHGYRKLERDGNAPAFPFGFGLSYTNFSYSNLTVDNPHPGPSDTLKINVDVSNTGNYEGQEVAQLYVSAIESAVDRAPKELKAFDKIDLQPGETRRITFSLPVAQLAYYDESNLEFVVEPIEYEVIVGAHSLDPKRLKMRFVVSDR